MFSTLIGVQSLSAHGIFFLTSENVCPEHFRLQLIVVGSVINKGNTGGVAFVVALI